MLNRGFALTLAVTCWSAPAADPGFSRAVGKLESRMKGRIGVVALRGTRSLGHRANERFAYCSTFKWVLGAAILKQVDDGRLDLARMVPFNEHDLVSYSPVTRLHLKEGRLGVGDLCAATITTSDNAPANLLEPLVGGLSGLQAFVRSLGDHTMRFDRREPDLNSNRPGDPRDTTTPEAMTRLLRHALESEVLSRPSRHRLLAWLKETTTGPNRIRAALPQGWSLAHKTGTGSNGAVNDVAVLLPPTGNAIYLSVFTDGSRTGEAAHERAIADVTRQVLKALP